MNRKGDRGDESRGTYYVLRTVVVVSKISRKTFFLGRRERERDCHPNQEKVSPIARLTCLLWAIERDEEFCLSRLVALLDWKVAVVQVAGEGRRGEEFSDHYPEKKRKALHFRNG